MLSEEEGISFDEMNFQIAFALKDMFSSEFIDEDKDAVIWHAGFSNVDFS